MADLDLKENLETFALTVSDEVRAVKELLNGNRATLALLNTIEKTNLVAAINETLGIAQTGEGVSLEDIDIAVNDYFVLHPQSFTYDQTEPAMTWTITHPLDHMPLVQVRDSAGTLWRCQVEYPSNNQVVIHFNIPISGKAILA